jgi:hypothetical protein
MQNSKIEEDNDVGERIILKRILEKHDHVLRIEFIWLRIRTNGELLRMR